MSFPIEKLMKKELQRILKSYGQPTSGRKGALEDRLRQHLSSKGEEKPRYEGSDNDFEDDDGTTTPHTRFSSDHDERLQELQAQMEAIEEASKSRRAQRNAAELELARQEQEDYVRISAHALASRTRPPARGGDARSAHSGTVQHAVRFSQDRKIQASAIFNASPVQGFPRATTSGQVNQPTWR